MTTTRQAHHHGHAFTALNADVREGLVLALAGGGMRHGQVIGATEHDGGQIKERRVTPGDLAATIYRHMGVPLQTTYQDPTGRPRAIVDGGTAIQELA